MNDVKSQAAEGSSAVIPTCSGQYAALPPGRHQATLDEIYEAFVESAPYRPRRELIFRALSLYADIVRLYIPGARLWIDGGFATLKDWAEPEDADVVVVVPLTQYGDALAEKLMPLRTLLNVTADSAVSTGKLHTMGGLLDTFIAADVEAHRAYWDYLWSRVKGTDGAEVVGTTKGYLEVTL